MTIKLSINSKSCTTVTTECSKCAPFAATGASLQGEDQIVDELQPRIAEEWERLDQRVIDNAVKQWRKRLDACVAADGGHFLHL